MSWSMIRGPVIHFALSRKQVHTRSHAGALLPMREQQNGRSLGLADPEL
jgi:hypothetical protein